MNATKDRVVTLSEFKALVARHAASSSPSSNAPPAGGSGDRPQASASPPEAAPEPAQEGDLTESDYAFLFEREQLIDARRNAFLAVGIALLEIREFKDGLLYAREFGTFERYCKKRWGFGRAYAYRLTDAANIFRELSPAGDIALSPIGDKPGEAILPTNEWQLRPLKKLPTAGLRLRAWQDARQLSRPRPPLARHVEKAVRSLMIETGAAPPSARVAKPPPEPFHKISVGDRNEIRSCMEKLKQLARADGWDILVCGLINRVDALLARDLI